MDITGTDRSHERDRAMNFARSRRVEFPLLRGSPLIYLDSAASQQKPESVLSAMHTFSISSYANVHRGVYALSQRASDEHDLARETVAKFIQAKNSAEVIFTRGTTDSLNLVAGSYGRAFLQPGDEIVLSIAEHHSNIVPWQLLAAERGLKIKWALLDDNLGISAVRFREQFSERTKIVAFSAHSNVLGSPTAVTEIVAAAHESGAIAVVDAAQAVCHSALDVQAWDADFVAFSGHKLYGPTGIGILYGREELLERMPPYQGGGDMIRSVTIEGTTYNDLPYKFEAGTPAIIEAVGLRAAINYIQSIGFGEIHSHERAMTALLEDRLEALEFVHCVGPKGSHLGLVCFTVDEIHPHDLAQFLDSRSICIRAGHHCAQPLLNYLGIQATGRASVGCYTSPEEIDLFIDALKDARRFFGLQ